MLGSRRRSGLVVEQIVGLVRAGGLRPGQALPTERELSASLGVSRTVVREAFAELERRGLVRAVRGSGRYLRDAQDLPPGERVLETASIADILEARRLLEVQVVELACERRTSDDSRRIAEAARQLTRWEDNVAFHVAVAAAAHNFVLERWIREQLEIAGGLHQRERYEDAQEMDRMRAEHLEIADAIAARDGPRGADAIRVHLERTRRAVVSGTA